MKMITPVRPMENPKLFCRFACRDIARAEMEITGLGLYRAELNGKRVGGDYLTPGFNDYDAYLRFQTYDVTSLLQADNDLCVTLGNGWYKGRIGLSGGRENTWGDRYLLWVRLTLTDHQGGVTVLETDDSWLAERSPFGMNSIYDGEVRDDTIEPGEAVPCKTVEVPYTLTAQFSEPIRCIRELKPTLTITPKGEQVLDFGQNAAGVMCFVNRLSRGGKLTIHTGEVLQQGCFYRDNLRSAQSMYSYVSDGQEKLVEPMFTFYGFRYALVEGMETVNPDDFTMRVLSCDLRPTLQCETDHPLLNQLMRNTQWGQWSNFLDVPTDCPQRDERLGWTADTQVFVNTACYQADCKNFYRKFMRDMRADQTMYYGGDIPMYSPSVKHAAGNGGAVWADAGVIVPWHVYMNYGDQALLAENYPMMRDYTEVLIAADQRLGGTHLAFDCVTFGDWLARDGMTPQSTRGGTEEAYIQGVYYMHAVELTAQAARVLNRAEDAEKYGALAAEIRGTLIDEYVTPHGRLSVDTQTGYVLALYYGVHRDKQKLMAGFIRRLEKDSWQITCGFTGAPLMLIVLLDNGMVDAAYRILLSEEFPGWLYAVKLGATTIWERWNSLEADGTISGTGMNSLNHYAYGSVCEAVYSRIMGLQNAAPGWKKAVIAPRLNARLRHSRIRFDSPAGLWEVGWDLADSGEVTLTATVPDGAEAEIRLPDHPEGRTEHVAGGQYAYTWKPAVDYMYPFTAQSTMMDLMNNEEAARILREHAPAIYAAGKGPQSECWSMSPAGIANTLPFMNPQDAADLDPLLRKVHR